MAFECNKCGRPPEQWESHKCIESNVDSKKIPFEIVYSRFSEDVSFLESMPCEVVVYNKGDSLPATFPCPVIDLPNVGMDCHSIFHHIATRYNSLAYVTLFLCGSFRKRPENVFQGLRQYAAVSILPDQPIMAARWVEDDGWPGKVKHWGKWKAMLETGEIAPSPYTLGEWFDRVIGLPRPLKLEYCPGQTFSVSAEHIHRRPRQWYKDLAEFFAGFKYPEECHHMERTWKYVFMPFGRYDIDL